MFYISINMIYTGNTGSILDTVELDPGGLLHQLVEVVHVAAVLHKSGQGDQVIVRLKPSVIQTVKIHITGDMYLVVFCRAVILGSSFPLT